MGATIGFDLAPENLVWDSARFLDLSARFFKNCTQPRQGSPSEQFRTLLRHNDILAPYWPGRLVVGFGLTDGAERQRRRLRHRSVQRA